MNYTNPLIPVKNVIIDENLKQIQIIYDNNETEIINKNRDGYLLLYTEWLKEEPIFISDKFKSQLRDITLYALRNDITNFNSLNMFFTNENKTNIINFFNYMRSRDLTYDKSLWTKS